MKLGYLVLSEIEKDDVESVIRGWALEVNAGAKYRKNDVTVNCKIDIGNPPIEYGFTEPQAWWDLMVGLKGRFILSRSVLLSVAANGGGFGLGDSSKFSYDFAYLNTFFRCQRPLPTSCTPCRAEFGEAHLPPERVFQQPAKTETASPPSPATRDSAGQWRHPPFRSHNRRAD